MYSITDYNSQGVEATFEVEYIFSPTCTSSETGRYIPSTLLLNPHVLDVRAVSVVRYDNSLDRIVHRELLVGSNNEQRFYHENVEIDSIKLTIAACPADGVLQRIIQMNNFDVLGVDNYGGIIISDEGVDSDAIAIICHYNANVNIHYDIKVYNSFTNQYRTQRTTLNWRDLGNELWSN